MEKATREYTILEDGHVVCGRGVGGNSIQCTKCQKWVKNGVVVYKVARLV